jgi:hypothetical protein
VLLIAALLLLKQHGLTILGGYCWLDLGTGYKMLLQPTNNIEPKSIDGRIKLK